MRLARRRPARARAARAPGGDARSRRGGAVALARKVQRHDRVLALCAQLQRAAGVLGRLASDAQPLAAAWTGRFARWPAGASHLDPNSALARASAHLHPARAMLGGVGEQVAEG